MVSRCSCVVVAFAILGVVASAGVFSLSVAGAQPFKFTRSLTVFDANGNRVGGVVGVTEPQEPVVIAFHVGTYVFPLWVHRGAFAGDTIGAATQNSVFFETTDCSGPSFALAMSTVILPRIVVARPGSTIYFADPFAAPQVITARSFLPGASGAPPDPCGVAMSAVTVVPAIPLLDLDTLFTPPFSVR